MSYLFPFPRPGGVDGRRGERGTSGAGGRAVRGAGSRRQARAGGRRSAAAVVGLRVRAAGRRERRRERRGVGRRPVERDRPR